MMNMEWPDVKDQEIESLREAVEKYVELATVTEEVCYTYIHTYIHTCIHSCIHAYIHIHVLIHMHIRTSKSAGRGSKRFLGTKPLDFWSITDSQLCSSM